MSQAFTSVLTPSHGDTSKDLLPLQIDGIYISLKLTVDAAQVLQETTTSDHRPVLALIRYAGDE